MKKVNLNGKLSLKKATVATLNDKQMNVVIGGGCTVVGTCPTATCLTQCQATNNSCSPFC